MEIGKETAAHHHRMGGRDVETFGDALDKRFTSSTRAAQDRKTPTLRRYQAAIADSADDAFSSGAQSVLIQLPTGGGKTVIFSRMVVDAASAGERVLILTHRQEILEQISDALAAFGVDHGIIAAGLKERPASVQVASIASIGRRLEKWANSFDLIIADEAHHAVAKSWLKVIRAMPCARILGVTATPERLDGRGLGDVFERIVAGPCVSWLIDQGFLSNFLVLSPAAAPDLRGVRTRAGDYAVEDLREKMGGVVVRSAVEEYRRHCDGIPAIAFCVDIEHSKAVAAAFRAAGVRAKHVDGDTPTVERKAAIDSLADGRIDVLTNVSLFVEGVDVPVCGAALLLRPTQSLALHLQMMGRVLRPAAEKARAVILDFAGNTLAHGLPDEPREWSLESKPRRQRAERQRANARRCDACGAVNPLKARECRECGESLLTARERQEIAIRLSAQRSAEEAARIRSMSYPQRLAWAGENEARLNMVAAACGYRRGWVWYQLHGNKGEERSA